MGRTDGRTDRQTDRQQNSYFSLLEWLCNNCNEKSICHCQRYKNTFKIFLE